MPKVYAEYLKGAFAEQRLGDRMEARNVMIVDMGYEGKQLPSDFPSLDQVKSRITYLRYAKKKKTGGISTDEQEINNTAVVQPNFVTATVQASSPTVEVPCNGASVQPE